MREQPQAPDMDPTNELTIGRNGPRSGRTKRRARHVIPLVVIAATVLAAAGCTGDDDGDTAAATPEATQESAPSPTPSPTPTEEAPDTTETLTAYFDGLDDLSEEGAQVMAANASPNSPAAQYAGYWGALQRTPSNYESETRIEDELVVSTTTLPDGTTDSTTFTDFEFDDEGLLVTWTSDPGGPLAPRITAMTQTTERNGLTVEFTYAYESNSGSLAMPVRVANARADTGLLSVSTYVQPSGEQLEGRTTGETTAPFFVEVEGGAFLFDSIFVEGGELGGTVLLEFDSDVSNPERVQVPNAPETS